VKRASQRFRDTVPLARSIARRWHFIEDVEQAAFLGLHVADVTAPPSMPEDDFRNYAYVRIRGEVLDHLRRVGGRVRGDEPKKPREPEPQSVAMAVTMGLIGDRASPERDPETQAIANEKLRAGREALRAANLTDRQRLIVMRRLAGDANQDIAANLGVSEARVSQLLAEAVALIRAAS
jgi:RNA polymerase sigma factor (sigma-70 family)